jgi:phage terminase large subunit GpA-like protein
MRPLASATALLGACASILLPPPDMTVSQWAEEYRILSREDSARPGKWSNEARPYQVAIMDAASLPQIQYITVVGPSQWGKTQILNNIIGCMIHLDPGPMMVVNASQTDSEKWSKTRFTPMTRDCPQLAALIGDPKSRDSSNTILEKTFPGGILVAVSANVPSSLAAQPIRRLFLDELDRIPIDESAGEEGDYEDLAEARTADFEGRRLIYRCSSPTIKGRSRIEKSFLESNQQYRLWTCPHCGHEQTYNFRNVVFSEAGKPEEAVYACAGAGCVISQIELDLASRAGRWQATHPEVIDHAGFYIHGLMVRKMSTLVKLFLRAKRKGRNSLQTFVNTQLGEWWDLREGETLQAEGLLARAREEDYLSGEVPNGVGILCASVDNQSGTPQRLEILVRGTGIGEEKWTILHHVIPGNLAVTQSTEDIDSPWDRLEHFLLTEWKRKDGGTMKIRCVGLDIGGHFTKQVYAFCRRPRMRGIAFPIKGATTPQAKLVRKSNAKGRLYLVDGVAAKDQIFAELKISKPGPGYQHFPSDTDQGYFEQLLSEAPVRNKRKYEKRDKDDPNEILDLHVYHDAALAIYAPRDLVALVAKAQAGGPQPPPPDVAVEGDLSEAEEAEPIPEPPPRPNGPRRIVPKHLQTPTAVQPSPIATLLPKPNGSGAW